MSFICCLLFQICLRILFNTDPVRKVHATQITCRRKHVGVTNVDRSQTAHLVCDVSVDEVVQTPGSVEVKWRKVNSEVGNRFLALPVAPLSPFMKCNSGATAVSKLC